MSIGATRMAALMREEIKPQGPPVAKADPAKAALVKTVAMPAPASGGTEPMARLPRGSPQASDLPLVGYAPVAIETQAEVFRAYLGAAEWKGGPPDGLEDSNDGGHRSRQAGADAGQPATRVPTSKSDDPPTMRLPTSALPWQASQLSFVQRLTGSARLTAQRSVSGKPDASRAAQRAVRLPISAAGVSFLAIGLLLIATALVALLVL